MAQDLGKLPRWAQQKIEVLEMDLAHWKKIATAGPETSNTFVRHHMDNDRPLGMYPAIKFNLASTTGGPDRSYVEASLRDDTTLQIMASTGIVVVPRSSNYVYVRLEER